MVSWPAPRRAVGAEGACGALSVFLLALMLAGCSSDEYRKAAHASDAIAKSIHSALAVIKDFYPAHLDKEEARAAVEALADLNSANEQFQAKAKLLKAIDPKNRTLLVAYVGELADAVNKLNQGGALHVKNAQAKAKLAVVLAEIQASVQVLGALVGGPMHSSARTFVEVANGRR